MSYFLVYRPLTSLVKFISRHFILFDAILDGIISSIFFSDSLLLDYRTTADFCILIFYPPTVLYSLISSGSFFGLIGFSIYRSLIRFSIYIIM